jgi:hypothetical protein
MLEKIKVIENKLFNVEIVPEIIEVQDETFKCRNCDFIWTWRKAMDQVSVVIFVTNLLKVKNLWKYTRKSIRMTANSVVQNWKTMLARNVTSPAKI